MGLWYKVKTHKKSDIIEVKLNTPFDITKVSRYKHWDAPEFCLGYSNYVGKLRGGDTKCTLTGNYPIYTVTASSTYVDNSSKIFVLITEKDDALPNSLTDLSKPFSKVNTLNNFEIYTLNKSNDFTLMLKKQPKYVKFLPSFKYFNIPLSMKSYRFDIRKVNNLSYKVQLMCTWANKVGKRQFIHTRNGTKQSSTTINNCDYIMATFLVESYRKNSPQNYTESYVNGTANGNSFNIPIYHPLVNPNTDLVDRWHSVGSVCLYTNSLNYEPVNLTFNTTFGNQANVNNILVVDYSYNPNYLPYNDCELEVLVIYE